MNFKKKQDIFFGNSCSRDFGATDCYPSTLIDLVHTALASKIFVQPKCMISEGYRTHGGVTGPMKFKKSGRFFSGKSCSSGFGAPGCHPGTLMDFVNTALAIKGSVETICMIWEGCRTHRAVTGPMNFKKRTFFFFGKSCSRDFGAPGCNPCTLIDLANIALTSKDPVEPLYMIPEG